MMAATTTTAELLPEQSGARTAAKPDTTTGQTTQQAPPPAPLTPHNGVSASPEKSTVAVAGESPPEKMARKLVPPASPVASPVPASASPSASAPSPTTPSKTVSGAVAKDKTPEKKADGDGSVVKKLSLSTEDGEEGVNPIDFAGNVDSNNDLPLPDTIRKIDNYIVLDRDGKSHTFRSLYTGRHVARRVLVIFVRHFYCGNCQDYLRALSAAVSPSTLLALPIPTFIVVIGCGDPGLIDMYTSETNCPFPVYSDPTRKLYGELGMIRTLALGQRPAYMQQHILKSSVASVVQGLRQIKNGLAHKGGDSRQIGGEFLFEPLELVAKKAAAAARSGGGGNEEDVQTPVSESITRFATLGLSGSGQELREQEGGKSSGGRKGQGGEEREAENGPESIGVKHRHSETPSLDGKNMELGGDGSEGVDKVVSWCHRMKNTRDHAEIPELLEVLGVEGEEPVLSGRQAPAGAGEKERERWERAVRERKGTRFSIVGKRSLPKEEAQ